MISGELGASIPKMLNPRFVVEPTDAAATVRVIFKSCQSLSVGILDVCSGRSMGHSFTVFPSWVVRGIEPPENAIEALASDLARYALTNE
jgi:hypothetical protein